MEYISREEHTAFAQLMESENKRICDENNRQNRRLDILEQNVQQISKLAANTDRLAGNMENMLKVQEQQGERLKTLEGRDGEKWRSVIGYILAALVSSGVTLLLATIF